MKRMLDVAAVVLTAVVWVPLLLLAMAVVWAALGRPFLCRSGRDVTDARSGSSCALR